MEYVYAAMLLHKAGQKVEESSLTKVLEAAGAKPDAARVKAVISALEGVDIDKAVKESAVVPQAAPAAAPAEGGEAKKEEKKQDAAEEKKSEEQAAAGLGALFG